jgi:uberolysin-like cyclical bacteriocin class IId
MAQKVAKRDGMMLAVAAVLGIAGLATVTVGGLWLAGSLGISTAAASQIVAAIVAGGWALRAVIIVFGAGLIGAVAATVLWYVSKKGRAAAIA